MSQAVEAVCASGTGSWKVHRANQPIASRCGVASPAALPPREDIDVAAQKELQRTMAAEARQAFVTQQAQLTQMPREAKRAMLCQQVVEAARYQRSFFERGNEPRPELLIAKRQSIPLVKVAPTPAKKSNGRARRSSPPTEVSSQQEAVQNASAVSSFMLLDLKKVRILLNDIHIILAATQPADYSDDVTRQLGGLYLFQPTGFSVETPAASAAANQMP